MKSIKKQLDRVQLTDTKIKVNMPEKVLNQIKHLCTKIHAVEWSGILFYTIDGSIKDPANLTLNLETILPMHKGTSAYTEYEFGPDVMEFMIDNEAMENDWKMAHIHSHNNMAVFFSGTDWSELEDNAPNHNFYLSLIVNNRMDFCAKVCFIADTDTEEVQLSYFAKDEHGNRYEYGKQAVSTKRDKLIVYDCDIVTPQLNKPDAAFLARTEYIIEKAKPKTPVYTGRTYGSTTHNKIGFNSTTVKPQVPNTPYRYIGEGGKSRKVTPSVNFQRQTTQGENTWAASQTQEKVARSLVDNFTDFVGEDESDIEQQIIESFSMYLLNNGTEADGFSDLEEVVMQYEAMNMSEEAISTPILENYGSYYADYFSHSTDVETDGMFIETTTDVIQEIDDVAAVTRNVYVMNVLDHVARRLERMLNSFIKSSKR